MASSFVVMALLNFACGQLHSQPEGVLVGESDVISTGDTAMSAKGSEGQTTRLPLNDEVTPGLWRLSSEMGRNDSGSDSDPLNLPTPYNTIGETATTKVTSQKDDESSDALVSGFGHQYDQGRRRRSPVIPPSVSVSASQKNATSLQGSIRDEYVVTDDHTLNDDIDLSSDKNYSDRDLLTSYPITPVSDVVYTPSGRFHDPDTDTKHVRFTVKMKRSLLSILRDSFLVRNPGFSTEYSSVDTDSDQNTDIMNLNVFDVIQPFRLATSPKRDEDSVGELRRNTDQGSPSIEARSWRCALPDVFLGNGELPWACGHRWVWRYLGENVYPSRVYEAVCEGRRCLYGHFNCMPVTYTLHVLQVCEDGCRDQRVPYELRNVWKWTQLNVTVGCQCVR